MTMEGWTPSEIALVINAATGLIAAIGTILTVVMRRDVKKSREASQHNSIKLDTVVKQTNGVTERLVETAKEAGYNKGKLEAAHATAEKEKSKT